jgi:molybdopterin converting factor small subunit
MDVRVKVGALGAEAEETQEILTGLPDGSLRSMFKTLVGRHPELEGFVHDEDVDIEALRIYVNDRMLNHASLGQYLLKDGDTVSLFKK